MHTAGKYRIVLSQDCQYLEGLIQIFYMQAFNLLEFSDSHMYHEF